ncbi:MAG: glycosyltransferase [Sphingobium sp.]
MINSFVGGGAERVFSIFLRLAADKRERYDFTLILLDREPDAYAIPDWIETIRLDCRKSLLRSIFALTGALRKVRPALTFSFLTRANAGCVIAARVLGFPCVISERVHTSTHFGSGLHGKISGALVRLTYPRADRVVTMNSEIVDDLATNFGVSRERITVVANPVDSSAVLQAAQQLPEITLPERFILTVGRLTKGKNAAAVIEAYTQADVPQALVILGEGPERNALADLICAKGLEGRVFLPGFVKNPYAVMARAEILASATLSEGSPNVLLEALALGVPTVFTNCPTGPAEMLADKPREDIKGLYETPYGILVPVGDIAAMADALVRLQDADLRARLRVAGPKRAAVYGPDRFVRGMWTVIESGLAGGAV